MYWEYYQQVAPIGGFNPTFDLSWICGLAAVTKAPNQFARLTLTRNTLYAVPFDVSRQIQLDRIQINLRAAPAAGAEVRVAIYENVSPDDNAPKAEVAQQLVRLAVNNIPPTPGVKGGPFRVPRLRENTRYWALLLTNNNCEGLEIDGIGDPSCPTLFWGADWVPLIPGRFSDTPPRFRAFTGVKLTGVNFGAIANPLVLVRANVSTDLMPALRLQFNRMGNVGMPWIVMQGRINDVVPPGTLSAAGVMVGKLASSAVYAGGTLHGATAYQDLATSGNTGLLTFAPQGSEATGGAAVGVRWNNSSGQGVFAYVDSSGPTLKLFEVSSGWTTVQSTSTPISLTAGTSYSLILADNGTAVKATIVDDSGVQTLNMNTTLNASNTEAMFGWIGGTANYAFNATITEVLFSQTSTLATPDFFPGAGTFVYAQEVFISSTPGALIYYTTDGSTPTTSSTRYTEPIVVSSSATVKAIAALGGWTNSAVGSATYTIIEWLMEEGTIDGHTAGTFTLTGVDTGTTSASAVFDNTWAAASAYTDLGTSNNNLSVTFVYQGTEGGGGMAVGLRWDNAGDEGLLAFIDTAVNPPVIRLLEMSNGWTLDDSATAELALTSGNT